MTQTAVDTPPAAHSLTGQSISAIDTQEHIKESSGSLEEAGFIMQYQEPTRDLPRLRAYSR